MDPPPEPVERIHESTIGFARTPITEDHDEKYGIPTLEELGFETDGLKTPVWIGGETEALGEFFFDVIKINYLLKIYFSSS